jgi:hypothetical protein
MRGRLTLTLTAKWNISLKCIRDLSSKALRWAWVDARWCEMMIRLPMLYGRTHEFCWYFCDFIRIFNRRWSSRSIPHLDPAAQPRRLVCASCPLRTASRRVRVRTTSDRRHGHSMESTRSCNVPGSLPMNLRHCLSTRSSPASHVSI